MERIVELFSRDLKRQVSASLAVLPDFPTNIVKNFAEDGDIERGGRRIEVSAVIEAIR